MRPWAKPFRRRKLADEPNRTRATVERLGCAAPIAVRKAIIVGLLIGGCILAGVLWLTQS